MARLWLKAARSSLGGANNGGTHEGDQGPEFYDASDWNVSRGGSPRTFAFGSFLSEDGQEDEDEPFFDMHDGAGGEEGLGGFDGLASPQQQGGGVGGFEVRAVADYASDDVTELCFATGDIIEVLNVRSSGWWKGRLLTIGGEWPSPTSFPALASGEGGSDSDGGGGGSSATAPGAVATADESTASTTIDASDAASDPGGAAADVLAAALLAAGEGSRANFIGDVGWFPCTFVEYCPSATPPDHGGLSRGESFDDAAAVEE